MSGQYLSNTNESATVFDAYAVRFDVMKNFKFFSDFWGELARMRALFSSP